MTSHDSVNHELIRRASKIVIFVSQGSTWVKLLKGVITCSTMSENVSPDAWSVVVHKGRFAWASTSFLKKPTSPPSPANSCQTTTSPVQAQNMRRNRLNLSDIIWHKIWVLKRLNFQDEKLWRENSQDLNPLINHDNPLIFYGLWLIPYS